MTDKVFPCNLTRVYNHLLREITNHGYVQAACGMRLRYSQYFFLILTLSVFYTLFCKELILLCMPWPLILTQGNVIPWWKICMVVFLLHSSPKEVHIDLPQFSGRPRVTDPDLGSCQFYQMVLTTICKRPHSKIPYGSQVLTRGLLQVTLKTNWRNWNSEN